MSTRKATHLRVMTPPDGQEPAQESAGASADAQATEAPPQYNEHDVKAAAAKVNELLAAIQRQGAMIPSQALAQLQVQAQAIAALRLIVNVLGVPEAMVQVAESQAMYQLLGGVLVQVEAEVAQRGKPQPVRAPGLIVPGRG